MNDLYKRINLDDVAVLLVDHQTGLISGFVRDWDVDVFEQNVEALVDIAKFFDLPTILTTSFDDGPNGPLMPYITETLPKAKIIRRPGQINAWDNEEFVKAVKATGKKQLIIAGVVTEVCVTFPALSAINEGFEVFAVTDASGTTNNRVAEASLMRMANAGVELTSWFSVASELQRDWRNDSEGFGNLLMKHSPAYKNVAASYTGAKNS
ncbi:isochorismate family cysteine hydrolase YcaC [Carnobacterium divergens]|uniref:isochorismate family cysteine hydrolase YcaC n=1 Tax=Carnobacterium divergens TaxID=2748 RepID=UPI00288F9843|nr:isochorismate family cysteine hydrolase YcaC [Carnobacterium divergens]MDT2012583.1 hydrolase [Carnobacterium divergens]